MRTRHIIALIVLLAAAAGAFVITRPSAEPDAPQVQPRLWSFDFTRLRHVRIDLPRIAQEQEWIKGEDGQWYFDTVAGAAVDQTRWGGGVPTLLSGPRPNRKIADAVDGSELGRYGLDAPSMVVDVVTEGGESVRVELGDMVPAGDAYYIRRSETRNVFTIDLSWYEVLERLVLDPPLPQ